MPLNRGWEALDSLDMNQTGRTSQLPLFLQGHEIEKNQEVVL